nr:uncharacterized protein LOC127484907 isoform X1 [Oryctolagus cuniculus]
MIHSKREALLYPLAGKIEGGSPRTRAPAAECRLPAEAGSGAARKRPCAIRRWKHPALPEDLVRAPTGSCGRLQHPGEAPAGSGSRRVEGGKLAILTFGGVAFQDPSNPLLGEGGGRAKGAELALHGCSFLT